MTLDVYRGRKTRTQRQQQSISFKLSEYFMFISDNQPIFNYFLSNDWSWYFIKLNWSVREIVLYMYSSIQMKCQGGNKYALSITVKFDQSTRKFGRISFARLFNLTKHIALLFCLLSPYLLSCMRVSRNVRTNMHIIKTITKFYAHWSTVCGMADSDAGGIRTQ